MRKTLAILAACLVISLIFADCTVETPPSTPSEEEQTAAEQAPADTEDEEVVTSDVEAFDSQVTIVLDRLQRADNLPSDITEELDDIPTPVAGSEFVCIYITIARIENIHMVNPLGYEEEEAVLFDAQGHEYKPKWAKVTGIRLVDPSDFANSPYEVVEGATGFLVFEVPKDEKLSKLEFVYSFKVTWEKESAKRSQIDLMLRNS